MSYRNFVAAEPSDTPGGGRFVIELQPFGPEGNDAVTRLELKEGATKDQAAKLQAQLNLLGVRIIHLAEA